MSIFERVQGVFFSPKRTFEGLAKRPVWVDTLVLVLVALVAFMVIVAPYMQKDQLSLLKDNTPLRERMGEDSYNKMIERTEHPSPSYRIVQTFVTTPLFFLAAVLLQALILLILGRMMSTKGTYVQVLSALVHASLIDKLLGNAVRLALAVSRGSVMQTSTSLALLFPHMPLTSTSYLILTQIDFFQLWMFGVLAYGLAAAFKIPNEKALRVSYGVWALKAALNVGIGMIGMSFLK